MKPILFNTAMVRAILEGRKTVTRRLVKPQPGYGGIQKQLFRGKIRWHGIGRDWKPPYRPGDILYVRETFCRQPSEEYPFVCMGMDALHPYAPRGRADLPAGNGRAGGAAGGYDRGRRDFGRI